MHLNKSISVFLPNPEIWTACRTQSHSLDEILTNLKFKLIWMSIDKRFPKFTYETGVVGFYQVQYKFGHIKVLILNTTFHYIYIYINSNFLLFLLPCYWCRIHSNRIETRFVSYMRTCTLFRESTRSVCEFVPTERYFFYTI